MRNLDWIFSAFELAGRRAERVAIRLLQRAMPWPLDLIQQAYDYLQQVPFADMEDFNRCTRWLNARPAVTVRLRETSVEELERDSILGVAFGKYALAFTVRGMANRRITEAGSSTLAHSRLYFIRGRNREKLTLHDLVRLEDEKTEAIHLTLFKDILVKCAELLKARQQGTGDIDIFTAVDQKRPGQDPKAGDTVYNRAISTMAQILFNEETINPANRFDKGGLAQKLNLPADFPQDFLKRALNDVERLVADSRRLNTQMRLPRANLQRPGH